MKAGLIRRGTAFLVDAFVAIMPALALAMAPGVFVPLDERIAPSLAVLLVAAPLGFLYVTIGEAVLPNTYGRYLAGVRVVDRGTGGRPSLSQAAVRALAFGVWPVEAALVAFSRSKRRLGDHWAGTDVIRYAPAAAWWTRLAPGLLVVVGSLGLLVGLVPLVNGRMHIAAVAREYVVERLDARPAGAPRRITIRDDEGTVTMALADGRGLRLWLSRDAADWRIDRVEEIPAAELGAWSYSIQRRYVDADRGADAGARTP